MALSSHAAVLRVPQDLPGVQAAMDASSYGDTVLVDRGTWTGLLQSPVHTLLLCSNYLFSGDSTDIVETVLDGEGAGSLLTVNTMLDDVLTVTGFTMQGGYSVWLMDQGRATGGAVSMAGEANACFTDIVFAHNRGDRAASVLSQDWLGNQTATGDLTLRRIHCVDNLVNGPPDNFSDALIIRSRLSRLIIDGFRYDGSGTNQFVMRASCSRMDTLVLANVHVFNCNGARMDWGYGIRTRNGIQVSNVRMDGCELLLGFLHDEIDTSFARVYNVEVTNTSALSILDIQTQRTTVLMDNIHVHHTRQLDEGSSVDFYGASDSDGHVLRNLHFHDNVHGDSSGTPFNSSIYPMVYLQRVDLIDAHIHDNRVIIPADPNIGQTQGNYTYGGAFVRLRDGNRRIENVLFENNRVEDLDDYSNPSPYRAPVPNFGRELFAGGDTLRVKDLIVRHSRQPNHCPEVYAAGLMELSGPGGTVSLSGNRLEVENLLLEDCDDGGVYLWADTLLMDHVVLRNVGRMGLAFGIHFDPAARPYYRFRNVWIENVDAVDNWLAPQWQHLSRQAALFVDVVGYGPGWPHVYPTIDWQNVTVTGCDGMRHLFNFYNPVTLRVRNSLFHDNSYDQLVEWDDPITQEWSHSLMDEWVPGEGILVGVDPQFDPDLGAPFLSPLSPCIDAGDADPVWNDVEDPEHPGFALWPAQGSLRNDLGFTGGPGAAPFDSNWVSLPRWEPRLQPTDFSLGAPRPNPFNPVTRVPFTLLRPMSLRLSVHNLLGQEVAVLVDGIVPAGTHQVSFRSGILASGLYLVTLEAAGRAETRTVALLR